MRRHPLVLLSGMIALTALACTDAQDPVTVDPAPRGELAAAKAGGGGSLSSQLEVAGPHLAAAVQAHGASHGAMFIDDVNVAGTSFIFFAPFPSFCAVGPLVSGDGSFYRQNPDGTVTIKLSGARTDIGYTPSFFTGPFYSGQGNVQVHMTGQPDIFEPIPGLKFLSVLPPFRGESLIHAVGQVIEDGTAGPSAQLRCTLHQNPDGSTKRSEVILR